MTVDNDTSAEVEIVMAVSSESLTGPLKESVEDSKGPKPKKRGKSAVQDIDEPDLHWVEPERNHQEILDDKGDNSLISSALELMNAAGTSTDGIKGKKVGLDLVQLGMAELQAYRLARIATTAIILEERLYSPENLRELKKPSQISDSLRDLNSSMKEALGYIQGTMSRVKFDTVEGYLRDIVEGAEADAAAGRTGNKSFAKSAQSVLDKISAGQDFDAILNEMDDGEEGQEDQVH